MAGTSDLRPYSIENPPEKIDEIMSTGKIAAVIVGVIVALVGIGLLVGGGLLLWANGTQRGDDGFFTTGEVELSTDSHAIVSEEIDLGSRPSDWFPSGRLATVRISATGDQPIFIGIGPESDVDDYLDGVAISKLVRIKIGVDGLSRDRLIESRRPGDAVGRSGASVFKPVGGRQRFQKRLEFRVGTAENFGVPPVRAPADDTVRR